jgi:hypothetical protein
MTKSYTISIIVSGEQGQVMRSDHVMPLAMIDVLKAAIDYARHYQVVAEALAVGPLTIPRVCQATGVTQSQAKKLLQAAGAQRQYLPSSKLPVWGLPTN